jgi:hypothetical protein
LSAQRRIEMRPLSEILRAADNPKDHDLGAILTSVSHFGFVEPMALDERTGRLVAGHGRLETLQAMQHKGHPPPDGIEVREDGEWLAPVVLGWSSTSDAQANAYLIASNRLTILGGWDDPSLAAMLQELAHAGELEPSGFDGDDLDAMLKRLADDVIAGGEPEGEGGGGSAIECPRCGETFVR